MSLLWPILKQAFRAPRRVAVVDDFRQYTYPQLVGGAFFVADAVQRASDRPHVGIMLPTTGAFPMAMLGVWLLGRTVAPVNYLLGRDELAYVLRDSDIDLLITAGPLLDLVGGDQAIPPGIRILRIEEVDFTGFPRPRWPARPRDEDPAVLLYTSGTSGKPKGVLLSHANLESNVRASIQHAQLTRADAFLGVLPQFHTFGLTAMTLIPLFLRSRVIYTARFIPKRIIELIREHQPDIFMAVPSMYGALLTAKDAGPDDLSSLRLLISGGEPLPDAVYENFEARFNLRILEGYGLTETSPVTHWSTPDQHKRHSVGQPLPGVRTFILDEHDQPLPPGQVGEIAIGGPGVMIGYYKLPELTREVLLELPDPGSGKPLRVFRTGDIGRVDEEGFLFITGRKKDMLIIGGENVFPREIEEVLNRHPAIHASAIIGQLDTTRGEVPIAYVELAPDAELDATELRSFCRDHLAQFKVPREIHRVSELPRSPTGKILRRHLREDLQKGEER
ncbi:MAG: class I adenylate-forming enzyme family protein [Phycisphaeraceae bacterium]